MPKTNGNFDSCNSCKRLVPSRLHELHESKFRLFHVSNLSVRNFRFFFCSCTRSHYSRCGAGLHQGTVQPGGGPAGDPWPGVGTGGGGGGGREGATTPCRTTPSVSQSVSQSSASTGGAGRWRQLSHQHSPIGAAPLSSAQLSSARRRQHSGYG